ncbi:hypothetical protein [Microbacterium sp. NPDC055455]
MTINIAKTYTEREEFYADILDTAVAGGINYWGEVVRYKNGRNDDSFTREEMPSAVVIPIEDDGAFDKGDLHPQQKPGRVVYRNGDTALAVKITDKTVRRGWNLYAKSPDMWTEYGERAVRGVRNGEFDAGDIDAGIADQIVQLGIFGKVLFG